MSKTNFEDVRDFHVKFELPHPDVPTDVDLDLGHFRLRFLQEELDETVTALLAHDLPGFFDGLIDFVYVAMGTAVVMGFEWHRGFRELHQDLMLSDVKLVSYTPDPSKTDFELVQEFVRHKIDVPSRPMFISETLVNQGIRGIDTNLRFLTNCYMGDNLIGLRAYLLAAAYAAMTVAAMCNLPWQCGWQAVQDANMAKVRTFRAEDSARGGHWDVTKPAGWTAPDIEKILTAHGWRA